MRVAVVGGGIAGLAAARRLAQLLPKAELTLVEREPRLGGRILTERTSDGFVIEGGADSFLARKERGVALCEELGIELVGRRPEHARSFVRRGKELHPLPEGLTGTIPTDLDALATSSLLTAAGKTRVAQEPDLPPAPPASDESVASFMTRRFGREAYEAIIEPLTRGIYGGDGALLSLQATFPQLRALELEHGSVLRGLAAHASKESRYPPFVAPAAGMGAIVEKLAGALEKRVHLQVGTLAVDLRPRSGGGFSVELERNRALDADGVVLAVPALNAALLLDGIDADWLAEEHYDMAWSSSAVVTLGYERSDVPHPLDGYGYLVPRAEGTPVLACTWTSSKWPGRAPEGMLLLRVFLGRFGNADPSEDSERRLLKLARKELRVLGVKAQPMLTRIHRWILMPQYVLGHAERLRVIETHLAEHPGLALAGAAYRGVGIPDCIASGEAAADAVAHALVGAAR